MEHRWNMPKKTLVERALAAQAHAETAVEARDSLLNQIEERAIAHALALKARRNEVPNSDLSIEVKGDVVTLKGNFYYRGGDWDGASWDMPLDYVNGTTPPENFLKPIRELAKRKADATAAREKAQRERYERAELKRLQEKYNAG